MLKHALVYHVDIPVSFLNQHCQLVSICSDWGGTGEDSLPIFRRHN